MSTIILAISCFPLPIYLDSWTWHSRFLCKIALYSIGPCVYYVTSTVGYCFYFGSIPSFFLELFLYWSPVAYWAPTDLGSSSFSILWFCLFILFMGFSRQDYWSALPFSSPVDHILPDLSTMTCPSWVAPCPWLSFIELDKVVVLVRLDWLVFCEYGFSVSALWWLLATPTILLGFLLPWVWGIPSRLLQQSAAAAPYLGRGVSPHHCPSWPSTWDSSSRPSWAHAATASWTWGWSSWPPPLASGMGAWGSSSGLSPLTSFAGYLLSAAAPDLGCGIAPPGRHPWPRTWVAPLRHSCAVTAWNSGLLPLTSDVG